MCSLRFARIALAALAVAPSAAVGLEPRFDHRDTHGPSVEVIEAYDTVAISGRATTQSRRPALRMAWGFDASGEGDEVLVGLLGTFRSLDDPARERVLAAADARYRAYFGTEGLKTFFDVGVWVPLRSRLAVGPLVGVGAAYDFSRAWGLYVSAGFATAFGQARITSVSIGAGVSVRFEMP